MWLLTLDMVEGATIVSSLATLAIAITSLYQVRRDVRDSFFPFLSVDAIDYKDETSCTVTIRNYGTGPALNIRLKLDEITRGNSETNLGGYSLPPIHLAVSESKQIELSSRESLDTVNVDSTLHIFYECIRKRKFSATVPLQWSTPLTCKQVKNG